MKITPFTTARNFIRKANGYKAITLKNSSIKWEKTTGTPENGIKRIILPTGTKVIIKKYTIDGIHWTKKTVISKFKTEMTKLMNGKWFSTLRREKGSKTMFVANVHNEGFKKAVVFPNISLKNYYLTAWDRRFKFLLDKNILCNKTIH